MERSVLARRVAPVAVFAAVLGGITVVAARTGDAPRPAARNLPALPLAAGGSAGAESRTAASSPQGTTTDMSYVAWGRLVIPDDVAKGAPTEGPAYRLDTSGVTAERVAALAKALDVPGEVRTVENGWAVGPEDRTLRVHKSPGPVTWYLGPDKEAMIRRAEEAAPATAEPETVKPVPSTPPPPDRSTEPQPADEPSPDPAETANDAPLSTEPCAEKCSYPSDCPPPPPGAEPACEPAPEPTKPPQPSDAEARLVAERVFAAAGLVAPDVRVGDGWVGKEVVASPVVDGLATSGFETRVVVKVGGEIEHAWGQLATPVRTAAYPLLAPQQAADRNNGYGRPGIAYDGGCPEGGEQTCPTPEPRVATKLRLGLLLLHSYDPEKGAFLAPAWLVTVDPEHGEEGVLALPDEYLEKPPATHGDPPPDTAVSSDGSTSDGAATSGSGGGSEPNAGTEPGSTGAPE